MTISVNGTVIEDRVIDQEVQYHPAATRDEARFAAARALVVKHLLLTEAGRLGQTGVSAREGESLEEAAIREHLEQAVLIPEPDDGTCRRYHDNNINRVRSPDLFEACHILFPAAADDHAARQEARRKATDTLQILVAAPHRFAELARSLSACPSAAVGGSLGQVTRGQTVEELETFFHHLVPGTLCPVPVPSRYGYHVLRLDRRELGRTLPFAAVKDRIASYLRDSAWRRAVHQYLQILVGRATIKGIDLKGAASPLVQ